MNLKQQLLIVSLLTLLLPWAGCELIRETESALRTGQQQALIETARAIASSMAQYPEEFPEAAAASERSGDAIYAHALQSAPEIDGYIDDWSIAGHSLRTLNGIDGTVKYAAGLHAQHAYFFIEVTDHSPVYADNHAAQDVPADSIELLIESPPYLRETIQFSAEAPGPVPAYMRRQQPQASEPAIEPAITAVWQDIAGGYRLEARIPLRFLGTKLGIAVHNVAEAGSDATTTATYNASSAGRLITPLSEVQGLAGQLVRPGSGLRLLVTDAAGWRIASVGELADTTANSSTRSPGWLRIAYDALLEPSEQAEFAEPDPGGREQQHYVSSALQGDEHAAWYRAGDYGRAVVAVATPVRTTDSIVGAVILQQGTEEVLSLTNRSLARLMTVSLITTLLVAGGLLGYASLLSRRIRKLSIAAEDALEHGALSQDLPSAANKDEIGDLSRSFSSVLRQLGEYNDYLRTLASKLSHELRTPLAIVTSSLENLEHEIPEGSSGHYVSRARKGTERLRNILNAMSEANRVEELMANVEAESFDLLHILNSAIDGYRSIYTSRLFTLDTQMQTAEMHGSPELLIQMLDKLISNAVSFSTDGQTIALALESAAEHYRLSVSNPGPPLPEQMRGQLFDSMVSVREGSNDEHLGLGLYIAKLIAEGHGGQISATNIDGGVTFTVRLSP